MPDQTALSRDHVTEARSPLRLAAAAFLFSVSGLKFYELLGGTLPERLSVAVDWILAGVVVFILCDLGYRQYKARARTDGGS